MADKDRQDRRNSKERRELFQALPWEVRTAIKDVFEEYQKNAILRLQDAKTADESHKIAGELTAVSALNLKF